jgi:hypothetical protein
MSNNGKWLDQEDVLRPFPSVDDMPVVAVKRFLFQIARGLVNGSRPWSKLGYNASADSAAPEDLWAPGGTYAFPASSIQMEVVSDSANDAAAGTGIQQVIIDYLDSAYNEHSEIVSLNGVTEVPTVSADIFRVNSFRAYSVGANKIAAGNIDIRAVGNTPIYSRIATGFTRARNAAYTVPSAHCLYITSARFSSTGAAAGKDTVFTAKYNYDQMLEKSILFQYPFIEIGVQDGAIQIDFEVPVRLICKTDIRIIATAGNNSSICTSSLRGWMEEK